MLYNKIKTLLILLALSLTLFSCSWIGQDDGYCPTGQWLQLCYTYNILDADATGQLKDISVYVVDKEDNIVKIINTSQSEIAADGNKVELSGLPEGIYRIYVWAGIADTLYNANTHGVLSKISSTTISLANKHEIQSKQRADLYYGYASEIKVDDKYAIHPVRLVKDTNQITCLIIPENETDSVKPEDYSISVTAYNAALDYQNNICDSVTNVEYMPFSKRSVTIADDQTEAGIASVQYALQTLRLTTSDRSRISLLNNKTNSIILDIPLSNTLSQVCSFYTLGERQLDAQEYLDRQDIHTLVFYLSGDGVSVIRCKVNNWIVRLRPSINLE